MANGQLGTVIHYIRRLVVAKSTRDLTDRELLHRYCALRDEGAFAALVQRHAQLVWGVCRQVLLHHEQDAEDPGKHRSWSWRATLPRSARRRRWRVGSTASPIAPP